MFPSTCSLCLHSPSPCEISSYAPQVQTKTFSVLLNEMPRCSRSLMPLACFSADLAHLGQLLPTSHLKSQQSALRWQQQMESGLAALPSSALERLNSPCRACSPTREHWQPWQHLYPGNRGCSILRPALPGMNALLHSTTAPWGWGQQGVWSHTSHFAVHIWQIQLKVRPCLWF